MLRISVFLICFLSSYFVSSCGSCRYALPKESLSKMMGLMGKTYKGTVQLKNGNVESFHLFIEFDSSRYSVLSLNFHLIKSAFADYCMPSGFSIKGYFTKESQIAPRANFTGYFNYFSSETRLDFGKNYADEASIWVHNFSITLDSKFTFSRGIYGRWSPDGSEGEVLSFVEK